jgi:hypothetical protein
MSRILQTSYLALAMTSMAVGTAYAQSLVPVAPGTVRAHLNGYLQFSFADVGGNGMSGGSVSAGTFFKNNSLGTIGDVRIYPGFDGMTVNNVAYGVQIELRTTTSNANGSGVNKDSTSTNGTNSLYIRRAYGYLGTTEVGYVRFGQTDGAFTLLQYGVIEQFGDSKDQWPGDGGPGNLLPSGAPNQYIYADQGALYTTDKIVYISPAVSEPVLGGKFNAIVSYEPNSNGIKEGVATVSGPLSELNDAIPGGSSTRRQNTWDGMIGYSVKMGSFASKIAGGYLSAQPLGDTTGAQPVAPMGVWQFGGQTTDTGVFTDSDTLTLGANIKGGSVADKYAFRVRGGRNGLAYIVGGDYTNGPYVIGTSFFDSQTAAAAGRNGNTAGKTLDEYGLDVGANYIVAKPLSLFIQYLYGHRHAFNIAPGTNSQAQAIALGATFRW